MKSILQASYNREAPGYDEKFKPLQYPKYEAFFRRAGEDLIRCRSLLDFGCGTALFYRFLNEKGIDPVMLTGIDFAERLCALAEARGQKTLWADGVELPFGAGAFDGVVSFTVLAILPEQDELLLREIGRVLRPGGLFWLSILSKNDSPRFRELLGDLGFVLQEHFLCGQDCGYRLERG